MPFGDGTGPGGMGPMTGRGAGYCTGYNQPGTFSQVPRGGSGFSWRRPFGFFGFGWGRGRGRGRGRRWMAPYR